MNRTILVCGFILLSGCLFGGTEGNPPDVQILLDGDISVTSGQFSYQGNVVAEAHRTNEEFTFNNVSIVLYNSDKQPISRRNLGTLTTKPDGTINASIKSDELPSYVVIESPEFWDQSVTIQVSAMVRTDSTYRDYWITDQNGKFET